MQIKKVGVVGAGVMGAAIAAHLANAGVEVVLLDIVPKNLPQGAPRSAVAIGAIERMLKTDPAPFMSPTAAKLITPGNLDDDMAKLADCDWIVEAVIENPAIEASLFQKIDAVRKPGSVVSSNTSTIPLNILTSGQSAQFAKDFMVTHFFNPPRYMRLLELVKGADTRQDAYDAIAKFCDEKLGKEIVPTNDTPGFIANRIGTFWLEKALNAAVDRKLTVAEADLMMSKPLGFPKTGVFGLMDLVGLDLMPHVSASLLKNLPQTDAYQALHRDHAFVTKMIADGYTGRKGKGGFYRMVTDAKGRKVKEAVDLQTGQYGVSRTAKFDSAEKRGLRAVVTHGDAGSQYAWEVVRDTLAYAASLVPEISDDIAAVDAAMKTGYNWKYGPFEMIDQLGTEWFAKKLAAEGLPVPPIVAAAAGRPFYRANGTALERMDAAGSYHPVTHADGVLKLEDVKRGAKRIIGNGAASLWDIGDGVVCLELHTKMNAVDPELLGMIRQSIDTVEKSGGKYKAMVLHTTADNFSAGANLGLALYTLNIGLWPVIEGFVAEGQNTYQAMKFAKFPIVGAPSGMALGGGCEMLLHCHAVQAHAETYMGLVEVGVGLVPGWGGCKEMLLRAFGNKRRPQGPMPPVAQVFETISTAKVSRSAADAKHNLFLRPTDGVTMNRDRLLADAKARALSMVPGFTPAVPQTLRLPGKAAAAGLEQAVAGMYAQGKVNAYDVEIAKMLARIVSGGDTDLTQEVTEEQLLKLEREAFTKLLRNEATLDRIEYMLATGKPLRLPGTPQVALPSARIERQAGFAAIEKSLGDMLAAGRFDAVTHQAITEFRQNIADVAKASQAKSDLLSPRALVEEARLILGESLAATEAKLPGSAPQMKAVRALIEPKLAL